MRETTTSCESQYAGKENVSRPWPVGIVEDENSMQAKE